MLKIKFTGFIKDPTLTLNVVLVHPHVDNISNPYDSVISCTDISNEKRKRCRRERGEAGEYKEGERGGVKLISQHTIFDGSKKCKLS